MMSCSNLKPCHWNACDCISIYISIYNFFYGGDCRVKGQPHFDQYSQWQQSQNLRNDQRKSNDEKGTWTAHEISGQFIGQNIKIAFFLQFSKEHQASWKQEYERMGFIWLQGRGRPTWAIIRERWFDESDSKKIRNCYFWPWEIINTKGNQDRSLSLNLEYNVTQWGSLYCKWGSHEA